MSLEKYAKKKGKYTFSNIDFNNFISYKRNLKKENIYFVEGDR